MAEIDYGDVLTCMEDVLQAYSCDTANRLRRELFKYTETGVSIWFGVESEFADDPNTVTVCGCVEGADFDGPSTELAYPFTVKELEEAIAMVDSMTSEMWVEVNGEWD